MARPVNMQGMPSARRKYIHPYIGWPFVMLFVWLWSGCKANDIRIMLKNKFSRIDNPPMPWELYEWPISHRMQRLQSVVTCGFDGDTSHGD